MKLFLLALLVLPLASVAHADNKPYGTGGCGLGSVLMGKDGNQVLAITTNDTSYTQTFGITSGTSNCVDAGTVKRKRETRAFIELNSHQLATDISKGGGETVASLAHLYRCTDEHAFGQVLQRHYQTIYPTLAAPADHVESAIQNVIQTDIKGSCLG